MIGFLILVFLFLFLVWFLLSKFIFYPLFFKPKCFIDDAKAFLEEKDCSFLAITTVSKSTALAYFSNLKKGFSIDDLIKVRSHFKLIGLAADESSLEVFYVQITKYLGLPFSKNQMKFNRKKSSEISAEEKEQYLQKRVYFTNQCPACKASISNKDEICPNCGLFLNAK